VTSRLRAKSVQGALYLGVAILVNIVAATQFFRIDLTAEQVHTLSPASIGAVKALQEPLTIRAFFTPDLRAPFNNIEPAVRDLLEGYSRHGGQHFNYQFYRMDADAADALQNQELARSYLISPIQIEQLDSSEVTVKSAYLGLAFLHGDLIETIGALTSTQRLEFEITEALQRLTERVSTLLGLEEEIELTLYFSAELEPAYGDLAESVRTVANTLDGSYFDRLQLTEIDPSKTPVATERATALQLLPLALAGDGESSIAYAAVSVALGNRTATINLFQNTLFGLAPLEAATLEASLDAELKSLLGGTDEIAYVADFATPPFRGGGDPSAQPIAADLRNFHQLLTQDYTFTEVPLATTPIPPGLATTLVVSPQQPLSEWALFQLDQSLMRGGSLIIFLDTHSIFAGQADGFGSSRSFFLPRETGLEPLLDHYGLRVRQSYVLDEQAFVQRQRDLRGSVTERQVPNAPLLRPAQMAGELPFTQNLSELVMLNASPIEPTTPQENVTYTEALVSSANAWEMADNIDFTDPARTAPPPVEERAQFTLAMLAEGHFTSYFAGREPPQPPPAESAAGEPTSPSPTRTLGTRADSREPTLAAGVAPGKIFLVGTSAILDPGFINPQTLNPNALLIYNLVDYMSGHAGRAELRGRGRLVRQLDDYPNEVEARFKTFGIIGPALIVGLIGVGFWLWWNARKRHIQATYR
jgi:ABC-2 type transport system permease protein